MLEIAALLGAFVSLRFPITDAYQTMDRAGVYVCASLIPLSALLAAGNWKSFGKTMFWRVLALGVATAGVCTSLMGWRAEFDWLWLVLLLGFLLLYLLFPHLFHGAREGPEGTGAQARWAPEFCSRMLRFVITMLSVGALGMWLYLRLGPRAGADPDRWVSIGRVTAFPLGDTCSVASNIPAQIRAVADSLVQRPAVAIKFVGSADITPLSPRLRRVLGNDIAIASGRADCVEQQLRKSGSTWKRTDPDSNWILRAI